MQNIRKKERIQNRAGRPKNATRNQASKVRNKIAKCAQTPYIASKSNIEAEQKKNDQVHSSNTNSIQSYLVNAASKSSIEANNNLQKYVQSQQVTSKSSIECKR